MAYFCRKSRQDPKKDTSISGILRLNIWKHSKVLSVHHPLFDVNQQLVESDKDAGQSRIGMSNKLKITLTRIKTVLIIISKDGDSI